MTHLGRLADTGGRGQMALRQRLIGQLVSSLLAGDLGGDAFGDGGGIVLRGGRASQHVDDKVQR